MAAAVSSPPPTSPPLAATHHQDSPSPSLPPIVTSHLPRRSSSQRLPSYANKRMSTFSTSRASNPSGSRPPSHIFPSFFSSLPYTQVRDFAYPVGDPAHYGAPAASGVSTPASESRRQSDPALPSWNDHKWSKMPPWFSDNAQASNAREHLPAMTFTDGGPPYSEDEDLHSPVVTTARHKKHKSTPGRDRGRSPAESGRGLFLGSNGDGSETYYVKGTDPEADGPGGELVTYPPHQARNLRLDASYPLSGDQEYIREPADAGADDEDSLDEYSEAGDDHARYSRNYSFTIASPDEEMHGKAVALFDFTSEHQNELPLKEGQIILVSYRHGQGWLVAQDPKTGESGLVPEEFVRLVRDIEGGLNGLGAADVDSSGGSELVTPVSAESATTPTYADFAKSSIITAALSSNGNSSHDKHPSVQSNFSTSSKDLDPYPLPGRAEDANVPALPSHPEDVKTGR